MDVVAGPRYALALSCPCLYDESLFVHMVVSVVAIVVMMMMGVGAMRSTVVKQAALIGSCHRLGRCRSWIKPVFVDFNLNSVVTLSIMLLGPHVALEKEDSIQLLHRISKAKRQRRWIPVPSTDTLHYSRAAKNIPWCAEMGASPANRGATRRSDLDAVPDGKARLPLGVARGPHVAKDGPLELSWREDACDDGRCGVMLPRVSRHQKVSVAKYTKADMQSTWHSHVCVCVCM